MKQRIILSLLTLFTLIPHQLTSLEDNFQAKQRAARKKRNIILIVVGTGVCIALAAGGTYLYQKQNEDEHQNQPQDLISKIKKILKNIDLKNLDDPKQSKYVKELIDFLEKNDEAVKHTQIDDETKNKIGNMIKSFRDKIITQIENLKKENQQIPTFKKQEYKSYIKNFLTKTKDFYNTRNITQLKDTILIDKFCFTSARQLGQYKKLVLENRMVLNLKAKELKLPNFTQTLTTVLNELSKVKQKCLINHERLYLGKDFKKVHPRLNLNQYGINDSTPPTFS